jgi:hypothetical protein
MGNENPSRETTFGFLSTLETPGHGYFGGYLIVSYLGRPLEFHCTSPVRPSRAQEILYGRSLQPYLLGEQISGTLMQAAKLTPLLILTDQSAILTARPQAKAAIHRRPLRFANAAGLRDGEEHRRGIGDAA